MPMRASTIFATAALGLGASLASATVVKDTYTNSALWNGVSGRIANLNDVAQAAVGSTFVGNGERLEKVGLVFSFAYGDGSLNNFPDSGELTLRFSFYNTTTSFIANPMVGDVFYEFSVPSNAEWQTQVGIGGGNDLYFLEVDVSSLNIITTLGQTHLVSLVPEGQWGTPGILSSAQFALPGGFVAGPDWFYYHDGAGTFGPATLPSLSAPYANVAAYITTTPLPCPGDINGDGSTNVADFNILASHFGQAVPPGTLGDLSGNGFVNVADFNILAGDFGCGP